MERHPQLGTVHLHSTFQQTLYITKNTTNLELIKSFNFFLFKKILLYGHPVVSFLCLVAKYHLGKVKFEQMQPAVSSSAARDLWGGLQRFCRVSRFIELHLQRYQLIFTDQKLSYYESLRILAPSPPSLFCIWLPG